MIENDSQNDSNFDVIIQLRIPSPLKKQFVDEAAERRMSLTDWIRQALDKRIPDACRKAKRDSV